MFARLALCAVSAAFLLCAAPAQAADLFCPQVASLLVLKCDSDKPCVIAHGDYDYTYIEVQRVGDLTSLTIKGSFKGSIEDGGADGVIDKLTGGGMFGGSYDSTRGKGQFSDAQATYEKECAILLPALTTTTAGP